MNKKGYMLVEIILASVIAFAIAYFVLSITIKLKNKNDDMLVMTLVKTDETIITNKLMNYAINEGENFDCSKLVIANNTVKYKNKTIDIVNDYTSLGKKKCTNNDGRIIISIPFKVLQLKSADYGVDIAYKYIIGDMILPTCTLKVSGTNIAFDTKEDDNGISAFGLVNGTDKNYNNNESVAVNAIGTYTGFVKDLVGNEGQCSIDVVSTVTSSSYTCKKSYDACPNGWSEQSGGCVGYSGCNTYRQSLCQCWNDKGEKVYDGSGASLNACNSMRGTGSNYTCSYSAPTCVSCPSGYYPYGSENYCYANIAYSECNGGTKQSDGCYLYNQSSCSGSYTSVGETGGAVCPETHPNKINENYCYK